jgi:RNA recognition motif-containing protein
MPVLRYGEVVNLNLVRDKATGKSKGFCFLCYEDQRSTVLAVDNLNGIKVCIALLCILNNYLVRSELSILRCFPFI